MSLLKILPQVHPSLASYNPQKLIYKVFNNTSTVFFLANEDSQSHYMPKSQNLKVNSNTVSII